MFDHLKREIIIESFLNLFVVRELLLQGLKVGLLPGNDLVYRIGGGAGAA